MERMSAKASSWPVRSAGRGQRNEWARFVGIRGKYQVIGG